MSESERTVIQPTHNHDSGLVDIVHSAAHPLNGSREDFNPLMELIGEARFVLLGAASHGTHEFYAERAAIAKRLIEEKRFTAVVAQADWPDAYRVNRYVRAMSDDADAAQALDGFQRFPGWMWRNADVAEFVEWLRAYNDALPEDATKVGFYGLDIYSLAASREAVLHYLDKVDPRARDRTRAGYECLDGIADHSRGYGVMAPLARPCKDQALRGLVELQESRYVRQARSQDANAEEEYFNALQNARVVKNADLFYRSMYRAEVATWNLRERHMAESLEDLFAHLDRQRGRTKVVLLGHNAHLGDARATEYRDEREVSVGQIVRQRHDREAVLVGFTTHQGSLTAASDWDAPPELKELRRALPESYEALFHAAQIPRFMLALRNHDDASRALRYSRLERSIGVIYYSATAELERASHYFSTGLSRQFDAVLHLDETRAVEPLSEVAKKEHFDVPESYPFGV
jgi:erythromycin esterase-like protein